MVRSATTAALFGALVAAAPLDAVAAQNTGSLINASPERRAGSRQSQRIDPMRLSDDPFVQPFDLFGIPLTADRAAKRERGLSLGVRPVKGVRAVAKLRF